MQSSWRFNTTHIDNGGWQDDSTEQIDEDEEPHREAAEAEQFREEDELAKVMHCRVDPPTTLGEQHAPRLRSNRMRDSVRREL